MSVFNVYHYTTMYVASLPLPKVCFLLKQYCGGFKQAEVYVSYILQVLIDCEITSLHLTLLHEYKMVSIWQSLWYYFIIGKFILVVSVEY